MIEIQDTIINRLIEKIRQSKKYRSMQIPESTIRNLFEIEMAHNKNIKEAEEIVRFKLHNLMAPYLGDPDYEVMGTKIKTAFSDGNISGIQEICMELLNSHASTRERIPVLEEFYETIFARYGKPDTLLDLACGLNPFAFPWMGLPNSVNYHAYDIHRPRVVLINQYFSQTGLNPLAEVRDVLLEPPTIEADMAFIFKEAHRMEQRQRGCSLPIWKALRVRTLIVSLPASSLSAKHDLADRQRHMVNRILEGESWTVQEILIGNEMIFCIEKK